MKFARGLLLASIALAAGCAVGPDYKRPAIAVAESYKGQVGWKPSEPNDILNRGPWWQIYHDEMLDQLERQVDLSNENIKAAAAAVEQAQALVKQAQAGFWPTVTANASRNRTGAGTVSPQTADRLGASASWTVDLWGQLRRTAESNKASAQVSVAALAAARLSAQAQLASTYFQLRAQDRLQSLLDDTVADQEQSLKITESRFKFGVVSKADVVTARTQLLNSQSQQANAAIKRALLEHAIAVLVGQQPATFSLNAAPMPAVVPTVPPGLPSTLLERRPDIAEAERRVEAANAQIGVAKAAYFPSLTLTGSDNYSHSGLDNLVSTSNRVWAFGPTLAETLFDGGLRTARTAQARAAFDASVDNYRQTVLSGFQQVEDQVVTLRVLEKQAVISDAAVAAAREAEALVLSQYKGGTVQYISVISSQTTRLNSEVSALTILLDRLTSSVAMIEAVGGGWNQTETPTR